MSKIVGKNRSHSHISEPVLRPCDNVLRSFASYLGALILESAMGAWPQTL